MTVSIINKKGKVINSLVRNAKMTHEEAKAAVVKKDEPKQQRAGKGVLKFDRYLLYKCQIKKIQMWFSFTGSTE